MLLCLLCCLYWVILEERLSVRVLASAVDDCLLCREEGFVSYLLAHRGGWTRLSVVPLSRCCFDVIPARIGFPSNSYVCPFCMFLIVVVYLPLFRIRVCFVGYLLRRLIEDFLSLCILCFPYVVLLQTTLSIKTSNCGQ